MSAVFEIPIESETLTHDELVPITGCKLKSDQVKWLQANGWIFHPNKAGEPIVGRLYARLKMAGINVASMAPTSWTLDLSKVS